MNASHEGPLYLWVRVRQDSYAWNNDRFAHIEASVVTRDGQSIRNFGSTDWLKDYQDYHGLLVTCQMDDDHTEPYAWTLEYFDLYSIKIDQAQRMVKTLQWLNRRLESLRKREGSTDDIGLWYMRIARIIGCEGFVVRVDEGNTSSYREMEFNFRPLEDLPYHVRYQVRSIQTEWQALEA